MSQDVETHAVMAPPPEHNPEPNNPFVAPEGHEYVKFGESVLNVADGVVLENVRHNIRYQIPQLDIAAVTDKPCVVVAGGWSLNDTVEELRDLYWKGFPVIALNGAGNWCRERNIRPAVQIVMDARPENLDFVKEPIPSCIYMFASQVDPLLFEECLDRDLRIFHILSLGRDSEEHELLDKHYDKRWRQVVGNGTITTRAIGLMRMLGYQFQHVFGFDSCLSPTGENHAYKQDWNPSDSNLVDIYCAGQKFHCTRWQAMQAHQFKDFVAKVGEHVNLEIYGDGLISFIIRHMAETLRQKE